MNRVSNDSFYNALVDIVCGVNTIENARRLPVAKPYYHYILITYYLLFSKGDLDTAELLYQKIAKEYAERRGLFDDNEKIAAETMIKVMERFLALRKARNAGEHKAAIKLHLEVLTNELEDIKCDEDSWGCIFKDLVIAELSPDITLSISKLERVVKVADRKRSSLELLDSEVIENYNIFVDTTLSPIYIFMHEIGKKELSKAEDIRTKIRGLKEKEENLQNKLEKTKNLEKKLRIYSEKTAQTLNKVIAAWPLIIASISIAIVTIIAKALSTVHILIPFVWLFVYIIRIFSWHYSKKIEKIRREVSELSNLKLEELSKIIWGS